jgi:pseudouridine synthase
MGKRDCLSSRVPRSYTLYMLERIQKILSQRGIASRRKAEEYITRGLVKVNGVIATLGQKADAEHDRIEVDGNVLKEQREFLYVLLHKPVGMLTHPFGSMIGAKEKRPGDDPSVRDLLPQELRGMVSTVGRLDKDSSGLLLLTNDGALAYRLTHPTFDHEKEYVVTVDRHIGDSALEKLKGGMIILGEKVKPARVRLLDDHTFSIALTEGKNRQIRRMCEKIGLRVQTLQRTRIVTLKDPKLTPGKWRKLTVNEVSALRTAVGLDDLHA